MGQGIQDLDEPDPRKPPGSDKFYPLLADFLRALKDEDDPETRAYPANITLIRQLPAVLDTEHEDHGTLNTVIIDLIIVGFFWLLRPAEYTAAADKKARTQCFRLCDIHLTIGDHTYPATTAPLNDENDVLTIQSAALTFSDQKNAVRGEIVSHRANNDPFFCPVKALGRIAYRLRKWKARPTAHIHEHYHGQTWYKIKPRFVTNALRHVAYFLQHETGIDPSLVSARSVRPGGATALLCARVDKDAIMLLGRWKSDAMFHYLRIQAATYAHNYAQEMLDHGSYTFTAVNFASHNLPNEAPAEVAALVQHNPHVANILQHDELYTDDAPE